MVHAKTAAAANTANAITMAVTRRFADGPECGTAGGLSADTALSLLAEDGATVLLMYDNLMDRNMPTIRLDRDELAPALEAEPLHQVRYESVECQPD